MTEANTPENMRNDFANASEQTLVDKAFAELEALQQILSPMPPEVITLAKRAHYLIDTYIDRPINEKEALKALLVLQFGYPFMFDDTNRFKDRYNQHLSDMVDELIQGKETDNTSQIELALAVGTYEITLNDLKNPATLDEMSLAGVTPDEIIAELKGHLQEIQDVEGNSVYASASRLTEQFKTLVNECLQIARSLPAQPAPNFPSAQP